MLGGRAAARSSRNLPWHRWLLEDTRYAGTVVLRARTGVPCSCYFSEMPFTPQQAERSSQNRYAASARGWLQGNPCSHRRGFPYVSALTRLARLVGEQQPNNQPVKLLGANSKRRLQLLQLHLSSLNTLVSTLSPPTPISHV